jgi:hypothetical protein
MAAVAAVAAEPRRPACRSVRSSLDGPALNEVGGRGSGPDGDASGGSCAGTMRVWQPARPAPPGPVVAAASPPPPRSPRLGSCSHVLQALIRSSRRPPLESMSRVSEQHPWRSSHGSYHDHPRGPAARDGRSVGGVSAVGGGTRRGTRPVPAPLRGPGQARPPRSQRAAPRLQGQGSALPEPRVLRDQRAVVLSPLLPAVRVHAVAERCHGDGRSRPGGARARARVARGEGEPLHVPTVAPPRRPPAGTAPRAPLTASCHRQKAATGSEARCNPASLAVVLTRRDPERLGSGDGPAYLAGSDRRRNGVGFLSAGWPLPGTPDPGFPLDSVSDRFRVLGRFPRYRNHVARGPDSPSDHPPPAGQQETGRRG